MMRTRINHDGSLVPSGVDAFDGISFDIYCKLLIELTENVSRHRSVDDLVDWIFDDSLGPSGFEPWNNAPYK